MAWLVASDVVVAEVTTPSLGVGYEVGRGVHMKKPTLCLYRPQPERLPSAMISGCSDLTFCTYDSVAEALVHIDKFMATIKKPT